MTVQLFCGDCLEILPTLDLCGCAVVSDVPYGIEYSSGHGSEEWDDGAIEGDGDTSARDAMLALIGNTSALVFGSWKRPRPTGTRTLLVWDTLGALGMGDLRIPWKPSHQEIYVLGDPDGFCGHRGTDVIQFPPVQSMAKNGRLHPMEKPVGLMVALISKLKAEIIVDPFMGVGSTGAAAVKLGRSFIGIEKDPKYFEIARRRIEQAEAQPALLQL